MSKKISFFIDGLVGGGTEGVCINIANNLADRGFNIELVVLSLKNGIRINELSEKVRLVELKGTKKIPSKIALWRYLNNYKPDMALSFFRPLSVSIVIIRCLSFLRFRLISRCSNFLSVRDRYKGKHQSRRQFWRAAITNILVRIFYPLSDKIIAQCQHMKDDLAAYLNVEPSKIIVIPNPVNKNIEDYAKLFPQSEIKKENYLLCASNLKHKKGYNYALEAFSRISTEYPQLRLKILGQGNYEAKIKQMASSLGIIDKVDFEGYQKNIIPYYVHARLTMLTSLFEGFPNVLIDSIALGTPVVSFDCPSGPSEIVQDGVNGFLVRYKDIDHLTECLHRALNRQWNTEAIRATADRFSSEKIIGEYISVLA